MSLADLIRKREAGTFANANPANPANDGQASRATLATLAPLALANPRDDETDTLPDPAAEARRQRVLAMLAESRETRFAVLTDTDAEPDAVIMALAIRDKGTCELRVPREKYDLSLLIDLIQRHGATVH